MGSQVSLITKSGAPSVSERTHPGRADWLTEHAISTGLSVVEVERLWERFQQLGCDPDGVISSSVLHVSALYSSDTFLRKLLSYFRDEFTMEGRITFQAFCNAMYWIECATTTEKLKAIFDYLNGGNPLDQEAVRKLLPRVVENDSEQGYERLTNVLFEKLGTSSGSESYIGQDTFVNYCLENISRSRLETILQFAIIPGHVSDEAKQEIERAAKQRKNVKPRKEPQEPSAGPEPADAVYAVPTDAHLAMVAQRACKRDYRLLGNKLGFYESDMNQVESMYRGDRFQQVYHMLIEWRKREGRGAYIITLQKVLQECLMPDIAAELNPKREDTRKHWNI